MKRIVIVLILSLLLCSSLFSVPVRAQQDSAIEGVPATNSGEPEAQVPEVFPKDEFYTAKILKVGKATISQFQGFKSISQDISVQLLDGPDKNKTIIIKYTQADAKDTISVPKQGETVVVMKSQTGAEATYVISDRYRLHSVIVLLVAFFILIVAFGRLKGVMATVGLGVSVLIIVQYIIPQILGGSNPFFVTLVGILLIAVISLYLAHGFNKRTTVALVSTLGTLGISILLARLAVNMTQLNGLGSEEAMFLQAGALGSVNLKGLLLGGILIGTLGVLDDITTSQAAAVDEISKANPSLSFTDLYNRGINVGHEHIASLVNTLFLAYAGASLPLFILLSQPHGQPLWAILNSEQFVEEIVRTVVGSIALILGVPVSTLLSAWYLKARPSKGDS